MTYNSSLSKIRIYFDKFNKKYKMYFYSFTRKIFNKEVCFYALIKGSLLFTTVYI